MSKILRSSSPSELNGFLEAGCEVQGELRFKKTFRVHGRFSGTVESEGELIVGEGGVVEGVVKVGDLTVTGRVEGRIEASRRVEIAVPGHVEGEIASPILVIASGAFFRGQSHMGSGRGAEPEPDGEREVPSAAASTEDEPAAESTAE